MFLFNSPPFLSFSISFFLFLVSYFSEKKKGMGRTFSSTVTVTAAPVVISPGDSHDEIYPHYTR